MVHASTTTRPARTCPPTASTAASLERLAAEIDDEFSTEEWTPIILEIQDDYPAALAALRRTDVVFVNSVRDGMNLVVLEALVLSERDPAVVISREMGAIEVLGDDVIAVNPFDVSAGAEALHAALLIECGRARRAGGADACGRRAIASDRVVPRAAGRVAVSRAVTAGTRRRRPGSATLTSAASAASSTPDRRTATL